MIKDEIAAFESQPFFAAAVTLRRIDDTAEMPGMDVSGLDLHLDMATSLTRGANG